MARIIAFEVVYQPGHSPNIVIKIENGSTYPIVCNNDMQTAIVIALLNGPSPAFYDQNTHNLAITRSSHIGPNLLVSNLIKLK